MVAPSLGSTRRPAVASSSSSLAKPRSRAPSVAPPPPSSSGPRRVPSSTSLKPRQDQDELMFKKKSESTETNIQVVVRVRGRAPHEPEMTTPSILTTSGPRCSQIDVAIEPPPASSTSAQPAPASHDASARQKTYHFDQVFGPEADQGMIYQDVVGPILNEVMSGYNCTIFAYGQTGTGKTHTMEGDLTSQMGTYSSEAGIIPRTLYRLFHTLEQNKDDYSVKASFIELYNEELRDLLSVDAPVPLTNSSNSNAPGQRSEGGLRMYDDAKGRGVVIHGLEEIVMSDAAHGLGLLRRGSQKRQIAATKCNEQSSRSHSVFTMTVHIKESGSKGEDVLKIGKLNLVDLAGSENIARSGAENKRAREAGMINQSLLTLGRVINALVEKSGHIPYRESKLTRILQESLGGRTKTCIIATVSQDQANFEETISTLDYALRAKSIRNRPEVNSRMNRSALIKEYVLEIERLKADLIATRLQNGVYLSDENFKSMQDESDQHKNRAETLRRNAEVTESKLISLKEQFEQNMQVLVKRESEVKAARDECAGKTAELEAVIHRIAELESAVAEESALKRAYKESEARLNTIASSLEQLAHQSTGDVEGLFAKLQRKSAVEAANRLRAADCQTSLAALTSQLEGRVSDFCSVQNNFLDDVAGRMHQIASREGDEVVASNTYIQTALGNLASMVEGIDVTSTQAHSSLQSVVRQVEAVQSALKESSTRRVQDIAANCGSVIDELVTANKRHFSQVTSSIEEMTQAISSASENAARVLSEHQDQIRKAKEAGKRAAKDEITSLRAQNELLKAMVEGERAKGEEMRDELAQNIVKLLVDFTHSRDQSLTDSVSKISAGLKQSKKAMSAFSTEHEQSMDQLSAHAAQVSSELESSQQTVKIKGDEGQRAIDEADEAATKELSSLKGSLAQSLAKEVEEVSAACLQTEDIMKRARNEGLEHVKVRSEKVKALEKEVSGSYRFIQDRVRSRAAETRSVLESAEGSIKSHQVESSNFSSESVSQLGAVRSAAQKHLSQDYQEDVATGQTPQKRTWNFPGRWNLVAEARNAAIDAGRLLGDEAESESGNVEQEQDGTASPPSQAEADAVLFGSSVDGLAGSVTPSPEDDGTIADAVVPKRSQSIRTLQDLPYGHNGKLTPSSSEELLDLGKAVKSANSTPDSLLLKQPTPATRTRTKRNAAITPAGATRSSKRAR